MVDDSRSPDEQRAAESIQPRWCVVANVVEERPHGPEREVRRGTKHFSPGTKVYLVTAYWGMGGETVTVLGLARRPKRWITIDVRARVLDNWRAKVIYDPAVLRRLPDAEPPTEAVASRTASLLRKVSSTERIRLVERDPHEAQAAAEELQGRGLTVLHASLPTPTAPHVHSAFVLYDGADPVASAGICEFSSGYRAWLDIWVVSDRADTLAELIMAVQQRAPGTTLWWLSQLVAEIRLARGESTQPRPTSSSPLACRPPA